MDMDVDAIHPSPANNGIASGHDHEMAIFWARIPKYLSDDASDISNDDEYRGLESSFEQRRNSANDLSAFNKPPPLSWDQQQNMDDPMKGDVDSLMSPLQDDEGLLTHATSPRCASNAKYFPMAQSNDAASMQRERINADAVAAGAPKSAYPQQLLKEVVTHARNHSPAQKLPAPPQGQQRQLFQEMRHSYQGRRPRQELPTPPQEQQQLLQELRRRQQVGGLNKKISTAAHGPTRQQISSQQLRQQTPPPLPPAGIGSQKSPTSPPRKDANCSLSVTSSPISVSEIFSGDLSREDYHAKVRQLTEKNLFERQQNLLQQSMRRTLESRKALRVETSWPERYERGDELMKVLEEVDSTSLKISQTYHLEIGFGAA